MYDPLDSLGDINLDDKLNNFNIKDTNFQAAILGAEKSIPESCRAVLPDSKIQRAEDDADETDFDDMPPDVKRIYKDMANLQYEISCESNSKEKSKKIKKYNKLCREYPEIRELLD